jgi:hypothetical protein
MNQDQQSAAAPVACSLSQTDLALRAERWNALADRAQGRVSRTGNGLRLTFAAAPGVADELEALAGLERDCCAFASWSVSTDGDRLALDVTAEDRVAIGAVQAMFDTLPTQGEPSVP